METAQAPDTRSFERIYDAYNTSIASYVRHQVGDAELAADLVQEIFIKTSLALASLDPKRNIAAWLFRTARNTISDEFRRRKRAAVVLPLSALDADLVDLRSTARQESVQTRELLCAAFGTLPRSYQVILLLRHLGGLRVREIAAVLKIPVGTAKARLARAQKSLSRAYQEQDEGGPLQQLRKTATSTLEKELEAWLTSIL